MTEPMTNQPMIRFYNPPIDEHRYGSRSMTFEQFDACCDANTWSPLANDVTFEYAE